MVMATSQKALEQMIWDLTEGFKGIGLEMRPCENRSGAQRTKPRVPRLKAEDAKVTWAETLIYVGICLTLNGSSAPSVQHHMMQAHDTYR